MSFKNAIARVSNNPDLPSVKIETAAASGYYCSIQVKNDEDRKRVFNASNAADKSLKEMVNIPIPVVDIYIEPVELTKKDEDGNPVYVVNADGSVMEEFGAPVEQTDVCPRMVLFAEDGTTYGCCSIGAYHSIKRICNLYGTPDTWKKPVVIIPQLISKGKGQVLSIKLG